MLLCFATAAFPSLQHMGSHKLDKMGLKGQLEQDIQFVNGCLVFPFSSNMNEKPRRSQKTEIRKQQTGLRMAATDTPSTNQFGILQATHCQPHE
ncbi:hypothetical protein CEXT_416061 [Caerostris extrusa]|uniref:Uncharacterized protein n=1 Tax=Caerostris extrusa TaxID=172846 RepID=A0AAV4T1D0_CAEEX|nr:hypothetical protein CEXT_416061 [Caerostris extrusa]